MQGVLNFSYTLYTSYSIRFLLFISLFILHINALLLRRARFAIDLLSFEQFMFWIFVDHSPLCNHRSHAYASSIILSYEWRQIWISLNLVTCGKYVPQTIRNLKLKWEKDSDTFSGSIYNVHASFDKLFHWFSLNIILLTDTHKYI